MAPPAAGLEHVSLLGEINDDGRQGGSCRYGDNYSRVALSKSCFMSAPQAVPEGPDPLATKIFSKSCSFQAILGEKPYFEQILGSAPPTLLVPLTKILDPPLLRNRRIQYTRNQTTPHATHRGNSPTFPFDSFLIFIFCFFS